MIVKWFCAHISLRNVLCLCAVPLTGRPSSQNIFLTKWISYVSNQVICARRPKNAPENSRLLGRVHMLLPPATCPQMSPAPAANPSSAPMAATVFAARVTLLLSSSFKNSSNVPCAKPGSCLQTSSKAKGSKGYVMLINSSITSSKVCSGNSETL